MSTLIRETETERLYWFKEEDITIDDITYIHCRTYTLTDRWRRTKDSWYKIEPEEPVMRRWKADFDIRDDYP